MPSWSPQPGDRRTRGQVWCPNNGDVWHLGRGTNPERLPGGGGAALKGEEERVRSRCVCTYWGHDGGGEKQRQRKQQQALRHLVSPNTGTGVTRRSPRIRENQNPCSASRGPAPALCSSPQWRARALESPSLVHGLFVTAGPQLRPLCSVSGRLASHLTYRRPSTVPGTGPPLGAVPDTLGENTHA